MRGVALVTLFAAAGCGSEARKDAVPANGAKQVSARFVERTVYGDPGGSFGDTLRGAFDWKEKRGWSVRRGSGLVTRLLQLGEVCYRRFGTEPWKKFKADDVDGLCDAAAFHDPATGDDLIRSVASDWEDLGSDSTRGVPTTHYRGRLNIGAVKGRIDLWVDEDGVVRREVQRGVKQGDFVSTRDYFDVGAQVRVRAPQLGATG